MQFAQKAIPRPNQLMFFVTDLQYGRTGHNRSIAEQCLLYPNGQDTVAQLQISACSSQTDRTQSLNCRPVSALPKRTGHSSPIAEQCLLYPNGQDTVAQLQTSACSTLTDRTQSLNCRPVPALAKGTGHSRSIADQCLLYPHPQFLCKTLFFFSGMIKTIIGTQSCNFELKFVFLPLNTKFLLCDFEVCPGTGLPSTASRQSQAIRRCNGICCYAVYSTGSTSPIRQSTIFK